MKIAYNPLGSAAYIPAADNKDLIFDLVTRTIYAKGIPFDGTKYSTFKKHTSPDNTGGSEGLVPIPSYSALNNRLLREDGQWVQIAGVSAPDDALSLESTNSVENKVITKKFNEIIAQLLLKAEHVYKNIVINGVLLQAQGANDTLTIIQGDGITLTPNSDNKAITISTKALGQQGIDISYSGGQLIAKVADTYYARWNEVFNWYQSVTEEDTDQYINKWQEIVDFLNNVQQGTNILDEFVTRKTDQTIIGTKTFSQQIISTVAEGTPPFVVDSSTRVLKLNADMVDDYHIRKQFNNASDIDNSSVLWKSNGECSDIPSMSYSALINVIGDRGRRWQIWNSRNNHQLYWRPELPNMSGYALEHILLDNLNYKGFIEQMYWANVPISATSSTTTSPTFQECYVNGWFRTSGAAGWYSQSYGGGIYMEDSTYVRTYNGKSFYVSNTGQHAIYTAGGFASAKTNGAVFSTYYNGTWYGDTLYTHDNGNLSISPPGGSLFLGYNRGNVFFCGGNAYVDRNAYFYAVHYYETSDIRKKNIISSLEDRNFSDIPIVKFTWKNSQDTNIHVGSIAQDVEKILPEVVETGEDGYKSIDYGLLGTVSGVMAIKKISKLLEKIESLEREIEILKNKN